MSKKSNDFSYMRSGSNVQRGIGATWLEMFCGSTHTPRFITHDPEDHFAGEFDSEDEAKEACRRWNTCDGSAVIVSWKAPPEDSEWEGDRGTYSVHLRDTKWQTRACSMDDAAAIASALRDEIADIGLETVQSVLRIAAGEVPRRPFREVSSWVEPTPEEAAARRNTAMMFLWPATP